MESFPEALIVWNAVGCIHAVNRVACTIFGYPEIGMLGVSDFPAALWIAFAAGFRSTSRR